MRPNLFANTPDILHEYLQHGGRPAFRGPARCSPRRSARTTASTAASSCARTSRCVPAARSTSTRRSTRSACATSNRPGNIAELIAPDERHPPRASGAAARSRPGRSTRPTTRSCSATASARRTAAIRCSSSSTSIRTTCSTAGSSVPLADWGLAPDDHVRGRATCSSDEHYTWRGEWNYVRLDPGYRVAHVLTFPGLTPIAAGRRHHVGSRRVMTDPLWYKDAIIYEAHVRAFFDSNNDGIGDFAGLTRSSTTSRPSASRACGCCRSIPRRCATTATTSPTTRTSTRATARSRTSSAFVDAAHRRDIRVITELVVNHTSDQHPWFQRARRAPAGSPERDFYVWSDTDQKFPDADHLHRHRDVELVLGRHRARRTTGTASSRTSRISISTTRRSSTR